MQNSHELELLAPAKNAFQGIEAIRHGADAVYIGAPFGGARVAVPVSIEEIKSVIDYAHIWGAKVYVALNTILYDHEVSPALELAHQLYEIGTDALIIQDLAFLEAPLPPIALHASTQMHNVDSEWIRFLYSQGIEQAVVARELSPLQVKRVHEEVPEIRLEAFIHGALCVSYSGRCYATAAFHGRSANRGNCSQICRHPFDLQDTKGNLLARHKHLLSLKDMNRSEVLPQYIDAGVRSFKIEGRLKDLSYVKSVTAHYHLLLNRFISEHPQFTRSSHGDVTLRFAPDLSRTFNRGFTSFAQNGRRKDQIEAFDTPKSIGQPIGKVLQIKGNTITLDLANTAGELPELNNGDSFTFFTHDKKETHGFRSNKSAGGNQLILPQSPPRTLTKGTLLYRSKDMAFDKAMSGNTATRQLPISYHLNYDEVRTLLTLTATTKTQIHCTSSILITLEKAQKEETQKSILSVLQKSGNTPFYLEEATITDNLKALFIPKSILTSLRQNLLASLQEKLLHHALETRSKRGTIDPNHPYPHPKVKFTDNILNATAQTFIEKHGATLTEMAYEQKAQRDAAIMTTKHCLRYSLNRCPHLQGYKGDLSEPWVLSSLLENNQHLKMYAYFNCTLCQMELYSHPQEDDLNRAKGKR